MSYSYSSFGSLLSNAGNDSLKSISTKNEYLGRNKGFDTTSIFNIGVQGQTGSYTGLYNSTTSGHLEKNFWSLVGTYTGSPNNVPTPNTFSSTNNTYSAKTKSNTTDSNNILAAASANSVSDLIALLPKSGSLFSNNKNSGQMSSFFA